MSSSAVAGAASGSQAYRLAQNPATGDVYAAGVLKAGAGNLDIWVARYSPALVLLSTYTYDKAGFDDAAFGVAVDTVSGDVFAAGYVSTASALSGHDIWLARFNSSLVLQSSITVNGSASDRDEAAAIRVSSGVLYVVGVSSRPGGKGVWLANYDTNLVLLSSGNYYQNNCEISDFLPTAGGTFVVGSRAPNFLVSNDAWIGKFDANHVFLASSAYNGPASQTDHLFSLAEDGSGGVFAAGFVYSATMSDQYLAHFSANLVRTASTTVNGPGNNNDALASILRTASGSLLVGGSYSAVAGLGGINLYLAEYDSSLNKLSSTSYASPGSGGDWAAALLIGTNQDVYAAGYAANGGSQDIWLGRFSTSAVLPSVPAGLAASFVGLGAATVSWTAGGNAAGAVYQLERSTGAGFGLRQSGTGLSFTDAALSPASTYYYRVRALNADLVASAYSSTLAVVSPPIPVYPALASVAPSAAATGTSLAAAVVGAGFDASAALSLERPSGSAVWVATGSFTQARELSTLTRLRDGRALLVGGIVEGTTAGRPEADLFSLSSGVWTSAAPMNQGRFQHAAVMLADGRVLVTGGQAPNGSVTASAEIYDPLSGAWTTAAPMSQIRKTHRAALLPDGRVLAFGGYDGTVALATAEIYDPALNTWTAAPPMSSVRSFPVMAVLANGKVLAAGGRDPTNTLTSSQLYDPGSNAWSATGAMSVGRSDHWSLTLPDGRVLAAGGLDPGGESSTAEVFDPATSSWTATGAMASARRDPALVLYAGRPLVIGGETAVTDHATTEFYDAASNAWSAGPSLTNTRTQTAAAVVLDDGGVLLAGGRRGLGGGTTLNTAERLAGPVTALAATGVSVPDAQHVNGTVSLTGAATGYWDVVVRQSGGRVGRLSGGVLVASSYPGCGVTVNVGSGQTYATIQSAVNALPASLSGPSCVVIRDGATYVEQVTIRNFVNNGYPITIMADPASGLRPVVAPPAASTAAFVIANASVNVLGISALVSQSVPYGIYASSAYVTLSSISVSTSGSLGIYTAGVRIGSWSAIDNSSVTVWDAHGLLLEGSMGTTVSYSTAANDSSIGAAVYLTGAKNNAFTAFFANNSHNPGYALYAANSDTNTVTQSILQSGYRGVALDSGSDNNTISLSTMIGTNAIGLYVGGGSAMNNVTQSYMRGFANGVVLTSGHSNIISFSTMSSTQWAIWFNFANSNTVSQSFLSGGNVGAYLVSSNYNAISLSTMIGNSQYGLYAASSDSSVVTQSYLWGGGRGAYLTGGSDYNAISLSTINCSSGNPSDAAFLIEGSNSNSVSRSWVSNPAGHGLRINLGAAGNTISQSTIASNASGFSALWINTSASNTVLNSYILGSTAAVISGSTGTVIGGSIFVATNSYGAAIALELGSMNLAITSSTLQAPSLGRGLALNAGNTGVVTFASVTINGAARGIEISTQGAGFVLVMDSVAFQSLASGATAFHFLGGTVVSTFSSINFDASASVNVNASPLNAASRITVTSYSGARGGAAFENDPASLVDWMGALPAAPSAFAGSAQSSTSIRWSWTDNASDETGYRVMSGAASVSGDLAAGTTIWLQTGLTANTSALLFVRAFNGAGTADSTAAARFTLAAPPTGLGSSSVAYTSATIAWTSGNPAGTLFELERSTGAGFGLRQSSAAASFQDTVLAAGASYSYRVRALNGDAIASAYSSTISITAASYPALLSIAVSPAAATVAVSSSVLFTAVGTFSDGSTRALNGSWAPRAAMSEARTDSVGAFSGGKLYLFSGAIPATSGTFSSEAYDPAADSWTYRTASPVRRSSAFAAEYAGKIFVAGGCVDSNCTTPNALLYEYDTGLDAWTAKASMPSARFEASMGEIGGKLYAAGGLVAGYASTNTLSMYDPALNTWTAKAPMPYARGQAASGVIGGKLYVAGGRIAGGSATGDEVQIYDPVANAWSLGAPMPSGRLGASGAVVNGRLYALGGDHDPTALSTADASRVQIYDPASNAWTQGPPMLLARWGAVTGAHAGKVYATATSHWNLESTALEVLTPDEAVWSSNAPVVGTVTAAGSATGQAAGTASISASSGAVSGSAALTVVALPGAPSAFAGSAQSTASILWTWTGSTTELGFRVLSGTASASGDLPAGTTLWLQTGLAANASASLLVQAFNSSGAVNSGTASVYTLAAAPGAPSSSGIFQSSAALSWSAGGNPAGTLYQLERSTGAGYGLQFAGAATTYVDAALAPGETHYFRVRAMNGDSIFTAYSSTYALAALPLVPAGPGGVAGTALGVSSITWSWTLSAGATNYLLYRPSDGSLLAASASAPYVQTGLTANTAYGLRVAGVNNGGTGALSAPATAYTAAAAPAGGAAAAITSTTLTASWGLGVNPASTIATLERSLDAVVYSTLAAGAVTSYADADLLGCTTYYYRVRNANGDGVATAYASFQGLTANTIPSPPSGLAASANAGGTIALSWGFSPTEGVAGYRLYWDAGTGTVSYGAALAVLGSTRTSFTTGVLTSSAAYTFALRAVHRCGDVEAVGAVAMSGAAAAPAQVRAAIKEPDSGRRVNGNRVTILGELIAGAPSDVQQVVFQYKLATSSAWLDVDEANVNHPNPDFSFPYFVHADVTVMAPGAYDLRAVAYDTAGAPDPAPPAVRVVVDPVTPDISETRMVDGKIKKDQTVSNTVTSVVETAGAGSSDPAVRVTIPVGAVTSATATLSVISNPAITTAAPSGQTLVGSAIRIDLSNGQSALNGTAEITLTYPDTVLFPSLLQIFYLNEATGQWSRDFSSTVDTASRTVSGRTPHFSTFAIMLGTAFASDLSNVRAYPVPFKPNGSNPDEGRPFSHGDPNSGIIFSNLAAGSEIRIYTLTGRLVASLDNPSAAGAVRWDARNQDGRDVASGAYFAVVSAAGQKNVVKKLVIIR